MNSKLLKGLPPAEYLEEGFLLLLLLVINEISGAGYLFPVGECARCSLQHKQATNGGSNKKVVSV